MMRSKAMFKVVQIYTDYERPMDSRIVTIRRVFKTRVWAEKFAAECSWVTRAAGADTARDESNAFVIEA